VEILVFGHQHEAVNHGGLPENDVGSAAESECFDVQRIGIAVGEEAG
jgi:hypothetical protein